MHDFWSSVHKHALEETLRSLDLLGDRIVIYILLAAIYLLVVWSNLGPATGEHETGLRVALTAALVILFPVVYLFHFLRAPSRIYAKSQSKVQELQSQLDGKHERQSSIDRLWQLRSDGIGHRNRVVSSSAELVVWMDRYNEWRSRVLDEAGLVNVNLRHYLERLDETHPNPANSRPFNPEHELHMRITSEILRRLQEYLKREF